MPPTPASLPAHVIKAHNFAQASENKMHSDDTAAQYGFRGGLVPGVGVYAYMTIPAVEAWGTPWLEHGAMWAKFLKPVYHGETVTVRAALTAPDQIEAEVVNEAGTVCAVGKAAMSSAPVPLDPANYPAGDPVAREHRRPPQIDALPAGTVLAPIEFDATGGEFIGESGNRFVDDVSDPLPVYHAPEAPLHPAVFPARANTILMANVALGPWIHTESAVQHFKAPSPGERVQVRGRVQDSFEKRGHAFAVLDVAFFGAEDRPLAHVTHTAIIQPALAEQHG